MQHLAVQWHPTVQAEEKFSSTDLISVCTIAVNVTALDIPYYHIIITLAQGLFIMTYHSCIPYWRCHQYRIYTLCV